MGFVLDTSVALAWLLADEQSAAVDALIDRLSSETAHVPEIWPLEVGNALLVALRRGRIGEPDLAKLTRGLSALPIEVDHDTEGRALGDTLGLARRLGLTTYDASYLELARRRSLPLATLDRRFRRACVAMGISALP